MTDTSSEKSLGTHFIYFFSNGIIEDRGFK